MLFSIAHAYLACAILNIRTELKSAVRVRRAYGVLYYYYHAITDDGARLDIAANGFWGGRRERAFFDVLVSTPMPPQMDNPWQHATENTRTARRELMNREYVRSSMDLLLPLCSLSREDLVKRQLRATRGSPL